MDDAGGVKNMNENIIRRSIFAAATNWLDWQEDYEFTGDIHQLPLLADEYRYVRFLKEYRPFHQRASREVALKVRDFLMATTFLESAVEDPSGRELERLAKSIAEDFPEIGTPRSVLSKIAMFWNPERFSPWDRFARAGMANHHGRTDGGRYPGGYPTYLADVREVWDGSLGSEILNLMEAGRQILPRCDQAFGLRVLDVYLMKIGGR